VRPRAGGLAPAQESCEHFGIVLGAAAIKNAGAGDVKQVAIVWPGLPDTRVVIEQATARSQVEVEVEVEEHEGLATRSSLRPCRPWSLSGTVTRYWLVPRRLHRPSAEPDDAVNDSQRQLRPERPDWIA
jgi:hypothetical protein